MKEINLTKLPTERLYDYLGHAPSTEWGTLLWKFALRLGSVRNGGADLKLKDLIELTSFVVVSDEQIKRFGFEDIICQIEINQV